MGFSGHDGKRDRSILSATKNVVISKLSSVASYHVDVRLLYVNTCLKSSTNLFLFFVENKIEEQNSESPENGLKDAIKDNKIIENQSKAVSDNSSGHEPDANEEKTEEETDGDGNKDQGDGNSGKTGGDSPSNDVGSTNVEKSKVEAVNEEKSSEHSKDLAEEENKEIASDDPGGKGENTDEVKKENSGENASESGGANDGQEGYLEGNGENLEISEPEDNKQTEDSPAHTEEKEATVEDKGSDKELAKSNDGVDRVKVDNEEINTNTDGHLEDKASENQPTDPTTKDETVGNESEVNKSEDSTKKDDEENKTDNQEKNSVDGIAKGSENVEEIKKVEPKENEGKAGDVGPEDAGKDEKKADTAIEKSPQERLRNDREDQNKGKNEIDETPEVSNTENVEEKENNSSDKTAAVEESKDDEIAVDPVVNLEGSHEDHSQLTSAEDNKSEVPSENIDDLVDEILAVTDEVDAGKKAEESSPNGQEEVINESSEKVQDGDQPVISDESSEKVQDGEQPVISDESSVKVQDGDQPVISDENSGKVDHDQPVVSSENSGKIDDGDHPMVSSQNSEKSDGGVQAVVSSESLGENDSLVMEGEPDKMKSSVENVQTSSDHLDAETNEADGKGNQRAGSGSTAYRVQTGL